MAANLNNKKAVDHSGQKDTVIKFRRPGWNNILLVLLLLLLVYLQAILWIGEGSLAQVWRLKQSINKLEAENKELQLRNQKLIGEIEALRTGLDLIEHRAREDLGLIKEGEVFYHVIDDAENNQDQNEPK